VSTVFLGTNHSFGFEPPLLFETMIFGGRFDDYQTQVPHLGRGGRRPPRGLCPSSKFTRRLN
jgi:hypothetical protein